LTTSHSVLIGKRCLVLDDEFLIALDIQQTLEQQVLCMSPVSPALALLRSDSDFDIAVS